MTQCYEEKTLTQRYRVASRLERLPIVGHHRLVSAAIFISWLAESIDLGGTGFILPVLREHFNFTPVQGGWFASTAYVGMLIGSVFAGALSDAIGRKKGIILAMLIWGCGGFGMALSNSVTMLFACRLILGIGLGAQLPIATAYLSELLPSHVRGKYISFLLMLCPVGIALSGLITIIFLPTFGWKGVYFVEALPALFFILIWKVCPESAPWLEAKGRFQEADQVANLWESKVLAHTGGKPLPDVIEEEAPTLINQEEQPFDLFTRKYVKIFIMAFLWWTCNLMGDYGLSTWLTQLLIDKGFDIIKSTGFVTIGVCGGIPAFFFVSWSIEKLGRKWSFLITSILIAISAYLYGNAVSMSMVIIAGVFYMFSKYTQAMCGNIYTPELFETRVRTTGAGIAYGFGRFGSIIGPIFFGWMLTKYDSNNVFYVVALLALVPGIAVMALGPETRGKKL